VTPDSPAPGPHRDWRIAVGEDETSATFDPTTTPATDGPVFVCAHGAGGNMSDRNIIQLSAVLRERGLNVVRFNFLYREKKSARPDPMPRLEECFAAVVARVREEIEPPTLIIGGRSMGGRAASMMAARNFACDGLLLLAYPLHPPGQPEKLRDAHLPSISVPVLCFNGTRDPFCTKELMEAALKSVKTKWEMHWVEGADHSFHVLKSSGRTDADVLKEIGDATKEWVARL
jgi:predicted alpha/beta-hydrolase family hydrolase